MRRPDGWRDRQQPEAALIQRSGRYSDLHAVYWNRLTRSLNEWESRNHGDREEDSDRDEMPIQGDVVDILRVAPGHASRRAAGDAIELHDHADSDVRRGPDHEHPHDGRI